MTSGSARPSVPRTRTSALQSAWWPFDSAVWFIAVLGVWGGRYAGRAGASAHRPVHPAPERVVVFGAGEAGTQLIRRQQADPSAVGHDGGALVLDMGESVRILDVARTLIDRACRGDIEIIYTGLLAGEKMDEELFGDGEPRNERPAHPLVSHVPVPTLLVEGIELALRQFANHTGARAWMQAESAGALVATHCPR